MYLTLIDSHPPQRQLSQTDKIRSQATFPTEALVLEMGLISITDHFDHLFVFSLCALNSLLLGFKITNQGWTSVKPWAPSLHPSKSRTPGPCTLYLRPCCVAPGGLWNFQGLLTNKPVALQSFSVVITEGRLSIVIQTPKGFSRHDIGYGQAETSRKQNKLIFSKQFHQEFYILEVTKVNVRDYKC